jgi:hypothetical protein
MDQKNKPLSFLDLLEHMKNSLFAAKQAGGNIEQRQKSLTEQDASKDDAPAGGDEDVKPDDPDRER